jgi:hypothetical protein
MVNRPKSSFHAPSGLADTTLNVLATYGGCLLAHIMAPVTPSGPETADCPTYFAEITSVSFKQIFSVIGRTIYFP